MSERQVINLGYIYKITNQLNNKVYIGQTNRTIQDRWNQHIADSKRLDKQTYLYKAFNKYGIKNFIIEEIIEASPDKLNELEIYYIKQYDSYNNGYNMTLGGDTHCIYDANYIQQLWDSGKSKIEIMELTGISPHQFWEIMKTYYNYSQKESLKRSNKRIQKPIDQFDLNNNYIQTFPSIQEAARVTKTEATNIVKVAKGKMRQTNGYIWKYH